MRHFFFVCLCCLLCCSMQVMAQPDDSLYTRYEVKYKQMAQARGYSPMETEGILKRYRNNRIQSDADFANLLARMFEKGQPIAVLLYFYERDTLIEKFFTPGLPLVKERRVAVSADSLRQLAAQLRVALQLEKAAKGIVPERRGILPKETSRLATAPLDTIVAQLSALLLPPGKPGLPDQQQLFFPEPAWGRTRG